MKKIIHFFDKLEDKVRTRLSHRSIFYAFLGGTFTIIFWRGVWHTADILEAKGGIWAYIFYEPNTIVWTLALLLLTGLFVSIMIGDRIILSGLKHEKKVEEKTEEEVKQEEKDIKSLRSQMTQISRDVEEIKTLLKK
jgi:hypothetical protein